MAFICVASAHVPLAFRKRLHNIRTGGGHFYLSLNKKILIAPLDWGLGHATRCVPLIRDYQRRGYEVVLAARGTAADFLRQYFPELKLIETIPAYDIHYPSKGSMIWHMVKQSPRFLGIIRSEHAWLKQIIRQENIVKVISDNRYGLYSDEIECELMTHQLFIRSSWYFRFLLKWMVRRYVSRFDKCLIPDYGDENNLSGELSHPIGYFKNVRFIGPQSRFTADHGTLVAEKEISILALISGPEPQRTLFQQQLSTLLENHPAPTAIICGQPGFSLSMQQGNMRLIPHLPDEELSRIIASAETLICRSGYSTLMDLHALGRSAVLIPTPGQTEQEYLAEYHAGKGNHVRLDQEELSPTTLAATLQVLQQLQEKR